jgi:hypothetical protein
MKDKVKITLAETAVDVDRNYGRWLSKGKAERARVTVTYVGNPTVLVGRVFIVVDQDGRLLISLDSDERIFATGLKKLGVNSAVVHSKVSDDVERVFIELGDGPLLELTVELKLQITRKPARLVLRDGPAPRVWSGYTTTISLLSSRDTARLAGSSTEDGSFTYPIWLFVYIDDGCMKVTMDKFYPEDMHIGTAYLQQSGEDIVIPNVKAIKIFDHFTCGEHAIEITFTDGRTSVHHIVMELC